MRPSSDMYDSQTAKLYTITTMRLRREVLESKSLSVLDSS